MLVSCCNETGSKEIGSQNGESGLREVRRDLLKYFGSSLPRNCLRVNRLRVEKSPSQGLRKFDGGDQLLPGESIYGYLLFSTNKSTFQKKM